MCLCQYFSLNFYQPGIHDEEETAEGYDADNESEEEEEAFVEDQINFNESFENMSIDLEEEEEELYYFMDAHRCVLVWNCYLFPYFLFW